MSKGQWDNREALPRAGLSSGSPQSPGVTPEAPVTGFITASSLRVPTESSRAGQRLAPPDPQPHPHAGCQQQPQWSLLCGAGLSRGSCPGCLHSLAVPAVVLQIFPEDFSGASSLTSMSYINTATSQLTPPGRCHVQSKRTVTQEKVPRYTQFWQILYPETLT